MVDTVKGCFESDEVDIQSTVSDVSDVSECKDLASTYSFLPESRLFLARLLVNSCVDFSKTDSTEILAGEGQRGDFSPVVTYLKVAFLRELYNRIFSSATWDSLCVPNGLERLSSDSGKCIGVGLQHFRINGVLPGDFLLFVASMMGYYHRVLTNPMSHSLITGRHSRRRMGAIMMDIVSTTGST